MPHLLRRFPLHPSIHRRVGAEYPSLPAGAGAFITAQYADAPLFMWPFADQNNGIVAEVFNPAPNQATIVGTITEGVNGWADGLPAFKQSAGSYLTTSTLVAAPGNLTLEILFRTNDLSTGLIGFASQQSPPGSASHDRALYLNSGGALAYEIFNGGDQGAASNARVNDGRWHLGHGVQNGNAIQVYVDSVLQNAQGNKNPLGYNGFWHLGAAFVGGGSFLTGGGSTTIQCAAIYYSALSQARITAHYAALPPQFLGCPNINQTLQRAAVR